MNGRVKERKRVVFFEVDVKSGDVEEVEAIFDRVHVDGAPDLRVIRLDFEEYDQQVANRMGSRYWYYEWAEVYEVLEKSKFPVEPLGLRDGYISSVSYTHLTLPTTERV